METVTKDEILLIVEDEALMRAALCQFLEEALPGSRILQAATGAQAIEQCVLRRPRVVLMDVRLPDTDGITLTRDITKMLPETHVIIVSSVVGNPYVERAKEAGARAYVAKENIYQDLIPHIQRALDGPKRNEAEHPNS